MRGGAPVGGGVQVSEDAPARDGRPATDSVPAATLSAEDLARSRDRGRVALARASGRSWLLVWLLVGPGILAMLGENDGPSMISYATTGRRYGIGFFIPFVLVTFAMAVVCQEMCMRVGSVTHRGYGQLVRERYGALWGWFTAGDLVFTNLVTLIAEFVAIRVGMAYFGLGAGWSALLGIVLVVFTVSGGRYWRWERLVLGMAVFNGLFLLAGVLTHPPASRIGHALLTFSPVPHDSTQNLLLLVTSTIGATVTPWMIFFQQSASVDKGLTPDDLGHGRLDTALGAGLAALFGIGALLAGAAAFGGHSGDVLGLAGAGIPDALDAIGGHGAAALFALGLIEAGAVAVLTISASTGYAVGECIGLPQSLNSSPRGALLFYGSILAAALLAAAIILIPGVPLLSIALNANVLATVLLPVTLVFVLLLASDRRLMGEHVNSALNTRVAGAIVLFISLCGGAYAVDSFLGSI